MKSLPTLLKIAQSQIDAIAVEIARAQSALDGLATHRAMILARAEAEVSSAGSLDFVMQAALPQYLFRNKEELAQIDRELEQGEAMLEGIRERLMVAYREKAKLESLERHHAERHRLDEQAREQAALDESALTRRG